jgi:hypothetical protein
MTSPPEFIISVSRQLGLNFEEIRQGKRNIESQSLVSVPHFRDHCLNSNADEFEFAANDSWISWTR